MRPKGWENPYPKEMEAGFEHLAEAHYAYEAGADAYEKALWKLAEASPTKTFTLDANVVNCPNVFIERE